MKTKTTLFGVAGAAVLAIRGVSALAFVQTDTDENAQVSDATSYVAGDVENAPHTESIVTQADAAVRQPVIPDSLLQQSDFIRSRWALGANLTDHYIQMTVPCGRDCFRLVIGNTQTGEIVETGMGQLAMPALEADSAATSDLILMMWENPEGGNCQRAIYRWDGRNLGAVSDIIEYEYTDAGCGQFNLSLVMGDIN